MTYTQVFGGNTIYPSDVSYLALTLNADKTLEWPLNTGNSEIPAARIIDVTPTGTYNIYLPDATQAGPGQTLLFNNLGPSTITVRDNAGATLLSITTGTQWQIYLVSNATVAGTWRSFQYGASTSQAQASALAGYGLIALGSTLAQSSTVSVTSTNTTFGAADRAQTYIWNGGVGTFSLPAASTVGGTWFVNVRNGGSGNLTIDPAGADTINAASTLVLAPADSAVICSDGTSAFYTIGLGQDAVFAFDYTSINLAGLSGTYTLAGSELNRVAYKFTGALVGNIEIVVPSTIQQYWIDNRTTGGSYTLGLRTSAQTPALSVARNSRVIYYCDGTDVVDADTSSGVSTPVSIADGGTGGTTAADARTNLGGTATGVAVFTAASQAAGQTALGATATGAALFIAADAAAARTAIGATATGSSLITAASAAAARSAITAAASGANTDITQLSPTGGLQVGSPTGGAQGNGTVNATGLFINGVAVGTGSGSVTSVTGSGGTTGLTLSGGPITTSGTLTLGGTLAIANGGTGQTSAAAALNAFLPTQSGNSGKALVTDGSNAAWTTVGTGTVTSVGISSSDISVSGSPITGAGSITLTLNTVPFSKGGTGQTSYTNGQILIGNTATTGLTKTTLTAGAGISITNGAGSITIDSTATGTVTSVGMSGGTTGLTVSGSPITTSGTITLSGTLAVANGGTGVTTSTGTGNVVLSASPTLSGTAALASLTISGTSRGAVGSAAAPSYSFSSATSTGFYLDSGEICVSVGGSQKVIFGSTGIITNPGIDFSCFGDLIAGGNAPASAAAAGTTGTIAVDTGFIYVCTATNTWKRVAVATW